MLKLHFNLDTLQDQLSKINDAILNHGGLISDLQSEIKLKTADRTLAEHLERLVNSVHKEIGEKVTKYKLDDPNYLVEDFITPDRKSVKVTVDQFVEKLEIVS
jgi:hypothetical protein